MVLGSDAYLREIAESVGIPCLRKDFTVDEYMIYEAKVLGSFGCAFDLFYFVKGAVKGIQVYL